MRPSALLLHAAALVALLSTAACGDGPTQSQPERGELLLITRFAGPPFSERPFLEVLRPDGKGRRQLTAPGRAERDGSWSPDGRRIAFVRLDTSDTGMQDAWPHLYVMDADGSHERQLTSGCGQASMPRWSPDGTRIVYSDGECLGLGPPAQTHLYVVSSEGGDAHAITSGSDADLAPDWSPDGTRILFRARATDSDAFLPPFAMFVVHPDGSGRGPLVSDHASLCPDDVLTNRWSPDGARIAFQCGLSGSTLNVVASDGANPVRLTGPLDPEVDFAGDFGAVWSPDGQRIATTRADETNGWQLFVTNAAPAGASATARGPIIKDITQFRVTSWRRALP